MTDLKTRFLGFCPICESDFKLRGNKLVHHGFTRPGVGYIIGDCLSVHELPYELSDNTCKIYKTLLLNKLELASTYLSRLENGKVSCIPIERRKSGTLLWQRETEVVDIATPNGYDFTRALEDKIQHTKYEISGLNREIARMQKWIDAWTLKPVRTLEEEMDKKRAEVQVRKDERDAKRAVKTAKIAATKAKQAAWEAEKTALMAKYKEAFLKLAEKPFNANTVGLEAVLTFREMQKAQGKKGYLNFYYKELQLPEQMWVDLGLATWDNRNGAAWLIFNRY